MEDSQLAGFNKSQADWEEEKDALRTQAQTDDNNLDQIRLTEAERAEKALAERDVANTRFHKVVAALRRIIMSQERKKEKTADTLIKVLGTSAAAAITATSTSSDAS